MNSARIDVFPGRRLTAPQAHRGLLLDKFLPLPANGDKAKAPWGEVAGAGYDEELYGRAFERWESFWIARSSCVCRRAGVAGRLAIGLGGASVHENAIRMHHTYGIPMIPGSSLKGVVNGFLRRDPEFEKAHKTQIDALLGTVEAAGCAVFQDAWWVPAPRKTGLALDVLTPHHTDYYEGKNVPPSDMDSPVPVHFLTATGAFLLVAETPTERWRLLLEKLLTEVVVTRGVGAKKSAGYGLFRFEGKF